MQSNVRYLDRTHRAPVRWLRETFKRDNIRCVYAQTDRMAGDIYTKAFSDAEKWLHAQLLINVARPSKWKEFIAAHPAKEAALEEVKQKQGAADDADAAASASNCDKKAMRKRTFILPKMWRDRIANSDIGSFPDSKGEVYYGLCYPGKSGTGNQTASAG